MFIYTLADEKLNEAKYYPNVTFKRANLMLCRKFCLHHILLNLSICMEIVWWRFRGIYLCESVVLSFFHRNLKIGIKGLLLSASYNCHICNNAVFININASMFAFCVAECWEGCRCLWWNIALSLATSSN